jgi:hypothetical protein
MFEALAAAMLILSHHPDAVADVDRSGPSWQARCRIDDEPLQSCRFTPLFGDGSFNIELEAQRQLRLIVDGEHALLFVGIAPDKQIRTDVALHRDQKDRACWVADVIRDLSIAGPPNRVCVYR